MWASSIGEVPYNFLPLTDQPLTQTFIQIGLKPWEKNLAFVKKFIFGPAVDPKWRSIGYKFVCVYKLIQYSIHRKQANPAIQQRCLQPLSQSAVSPQSLKDDFW